MKKQLFLLCLTAAFAVAACTDESDKDPNFMPPAILTEEEEVTYPDDLPTPGEMMPYEESGRPYRPIVVKYSSGYPPITSWKQANTRLLAYMYGYERKVSTYEEYSAITDEYGACTAAGAQQATGRFHVKKIGDRWWIIDPHGYPYYMRGVASFRKGTSDRNKKAWNERFGSDDNWVSVCRNELARMGVHSTGAFGSNGAYGIQQNYNTANTSAPFPLAPSFGFLSQFRTQKKHAYADGNSANEVGLVLYEDWGAFCEEYMRSTAFQPYVNDKNTFGFFSDNELDFSSQNSAILQRFLDIKDQSDVAYLAARAFMDEKGASKVTDALNSEFAGMLAEKYYKGVREALDKVDPQLLYLGSRLHGTPKYLEGVVRAAGKYCDIVSINYYSRWSPEGTKMAEWAEWAGKPFVVTEFYTKGVEDSDLNNGSGAGFCVPTQKERAYAYQHFTLGLLEAKNCVGWYWFKYQDDDGTDNSGKPANKGIYDNYYQPFPYLSQMMREINYNVYNIIEYFDDQK